MGEKFFSNSCLVYGRGSRLRKPKSQNPSRSETSDVAFSRGKNTRYPNKTVAITRDGREILFESLYQSCYQAPSNTLHGKPAEVSELRNFGARKARGGVGASAQEKTRRLPSPVMGEKFFSKVSIRVAIRLPRIPYTESPRRCRNFGARKARGGVGAAASRRGKKNRLKKTRRLPSLVMGEKFFLKATEFLALELRTHQALEAR